MKTKRWTCSGCGMQFGGLSGFDKHRAADGSAGHPHYGRRCRSVEEMAAFGYVLKNGVLIHPMTAEVRMRLEGATEA